MKRSLFGRFGPWTVDLSSGPHCIDNTVEVNRSPIEVDSALAEVGLLILINFVLGRLRVHRAPRLGGHQSRAALWDLGNQTSNISVDFWRKIW